MVTAAKWDPSSWAVQIGPLLTGPAQVAYWALTKAEAWDYRKVKEAILYHLEISPETSRQKFQARKGAEGSRPRLTQTRRDLVEQWLQPET